MGTIFNSKVFKGVSIAGKTVKGMVKNGVVFWKSLPTDYILAYSFNGNTSDASVNGLNGAMTGTLAFDTGRKIGTQSLKFTKGCVKTTLPLPVNSDKVTIAFWMKTTMTASGMVVELSADSDVNNAFYSIMNNATTNYLSLRNRNGGNYSFVKANVTNSSWKHIVCTIDRSQSVSNECKIYVNGTLTSIMVVTSGDVSGNFVNNILFIGQRNASLYPFVGNLQDLKIYNRVLSENEITALYNE